MIAFGSWFEPFVVAAAVTIVSVPLVRRLAVRTGFLDRPAPHKAHAVPTPYLGGVAICAGVLVAILAARTTLHSGVIGLAAAVLFVVGLLDDRRGVHPFLKLAIQGGCAGAIFAIGVLLQAPGVWLHLTGFKALDLIATFGLFVLMPNSVNLLDNTDGCAAGVVAASAGCVLAESVLLSLHNVPIAAAAMTGALLGFLVFNRRPASIFMGDGGSLPLGILLAVLAVRAGSRLHAPVGAEVSLLFLGMPLADTFTVLVARLTQGRSIFQGGQDHLSHRLTYVTGMTIGWATWILIAAQVLLGGVAVGVAVGALSFWLGLALAVVITASVMIPALRPAISRAIYRTVPRQPAVATAPTDAVA